MEELPIPKGLNVTVEPSELLISPHKRYTFKIIVETAPDISDTYVFCIRSEFEDGAIADVWFRVNVIPQSENSNLPFILAVLAFITAVALRRWLGWLGSFKSALLLLHLIYVTSSAKGCGCA